MANIDFEYLKLLNTIKSKGDIKDDRTGTGTISYFGYQLRHDLSENFPLLTTKKLHLRSIIYELLWFLKGDTNVKYLNDNGVKIWDEWSNENGDLGRIYGAQWRSWEGVDGRTHDQISNVIDTIKNNPDSRRIIVSAWNVGDLDKMSLMPCHCLFQFHVVNNKLSCQLYQRSCDVFLGVPFNIASYAILTHMIAHVCGLEVGDYIHTFGDVHIYSNHIDQVNEQLSRNPKTPPQINVNARNREIKSIFDFEYEDFEIIGYEAHPSIKAPVAV